MEDESDEEKETGGEARGGRRLPFTPFAGFFLFSFSFFFLFLSLICLTEIS